MGNFRWQNVEQFIGIANLLSLRNNGQIVPKVGKDDEDIDVGDDGDSERATVLAGGEDDLKQRFLDRLAEAMSPDKGGGDVTCVALHQPAPTSIVLLVARNDGFKDVDREFCLVLQKLLTDIGSSVEQNKLEELADALWQELLRYGGRRLDGYASSLQEDLRGFKTQVSYKSIPFDAEATKFCDDVNVGCYANDTHKAYMQFAQTQINQLKDIFRSGDKSTQRRLLAEKAYDMRHMTSVEIFINNSSSRPSLAHKLITDIRFLGRLRSCYLTLLEAAKDITGFSDTSILLVSKPQPRTSPSTLPTLADTFKYVGLSLDPESVHKFINPKMTVKGAEAEFKECQRSTGGKRQKLYTHAEVQLILYLAKTITDKLGIKEIFPYIGCSKLSCFLCYTFLQCFDLGGAPFKTRGCHGKLYTQWSVPDTEGLQDVMAEELNLALKNMRNRLARQVMKPVRLSAREVAESSAAVTLPRPAQSSYIQQYDGGDATRNRFEFWQSVARDAGLYSESPDEADERENVQILGRDIPAAKVSKIGECKKCERETSRKCSKCSGPWLCSESCENKYDSSHHNRVCAIGRPLDTADYLREACFADELPRDEETLQDFGFSKFPSARDRSKLFGLYVGLCLYMEVGHRELHQWQREETLVENIKSKYEEIPESHRGGYYPWFLNNLHIFQGESKAPHLMDAALPYLDPAEDPYDLKPRAKQLSFILYTLLLNAWHPDPTQSDDLSQDLYFKFGFCTGCGDEGEQEVGRLYQALISRCSFKEFWTAYESKSLISLFDAYGLNTECRRIKHLEAFLNREKLGMESVWHLRAFTQSANTYPIPSVAADYGFIGCKTAEELIALKDVYKKLLESPRVDPMELHRACIEGKLYDFAKKYLPDLEPRFRRLMKNLYPLF